MKNWPVMIAVNANRNTISEDASLSKLSPSAMVTMFLGTFTCFIMVVAETASGGETMPPSKKPSANVNPAIITWDTNATTQAVNITIGKAKLMITLLNFRNSFHETCQAASYNKGGRKMKKTKSGS